MRRVKAAITVVVFALVMSVGASALCVRAAGEVAQPIQRNTSFVVSEPMHPRGLRIAHPSANEIAAYATEVHHAQMRAAFVSWLNGLSERARTSVRVVSGPVVVSSSETTIGEGVPCDGDLTPCWRVRIESGGTWNAYNPTGCGGSSCFGPYQFSGAWAGQLGLPLDLATATHAQWVAADRELWEHGRGGSNWSAC